jgi:two-component system LytT family response regulator
MRCLIVDDEEPACRELRQLLSLHPEMEVVGQAVDVDAALEATDRLSPEVVFLDIKLAGETGFDYIARLAEPLPHIVFVTAYDRYAIRGFECNALDYLLKPVRPERLQETLSRLHRVQASPPRAAIDDVVFLKAASVARFMPWRDVHHILSEGNYTRVFLNDGAVLLIARPLKKWLELIPEEFFLRVHRTAIIRRDAMRELRVSGGKRELLLSDGAAIPISRSHWSILKPSLG